MRIALVPLHFLLSVILVAPYPSCVFCWLYVSFFFGGTCICNQVQHYVHFNLSLSLLLGLIVFVSGIETATDSDVSLCRFTDIILACLYIFIIVGWLYNCSNTSALLFSSSILLDALWRPLNTFVTLFCILQRIS